MKKEGISGLLNKWLVFLFILTMVTIGCGNENIGKMAKLHCGKPGDPDYKYFAGAIIEWEEGNYIAIRLYDIYFRSTDSYQIEAERRVVRYDFKNLPPSFLKGNYLNKYGYVTKVEILSQTEAEYAKTFYEKYAEELEKIKSGK